MCDACCLHPAAGARIHLSFTVPTDAGHYMFRTYNTRFDIRGYRGELDRQ